MKTLLLLPCLAACLFAGPAKLTFTKTFAGSIPEFCSCLLYTSEPRGDKRLKPAVGYARIVSLKPTDAAVTYSHGGETHRVTDCLLYTSRCV